MQPKFSIIIPTYLRSDKLKQCLASIVRYTNMEEAECIVVANGAAEETRMVCAGFPVKLLWYDEPLGYPKAVNRGIEAAQGEFIVLLNDDAELLSQSHSKWIEVMLKPMLQDGAVGITGPLMAYDENSNHEFLIFFCVMIRRQCIAEVGLLDEGFTYFGEDTAFCIEAEKKGWKVIRVPEEHPTQLVPLDPSTTTLEAWKHDKVHSGNFPIWHDAESTIGRLPDCDEVLRKSRARLKQLYGNPDDVNVHRAMVTDGWIAHDELIWLARQAKTCGPNAVIVQIGAWHGKSSRAISDNMCAGSKLIDVDTFNGSSGEPDQHISAKEREGDGCFQWYFDNQYEQILRGEVIPMRMLSHNAAHSLAHRGIKADMIFIDGDHSAEGIQRDVEAWLPLLKEGGLLCGHDYYKENEGPWWVHVRQYVEEKFPQVEKAATSIWHVRPYEQVTQERGRTFDCFLFHNELDVLEIRLATLYDHVDHFVLVEARETHAGQPKPLHFDDNKERFAPYLNKVRHVVIDKFPEFEGSVYDKAWARERFQRDACMTALHDAEPNDVVIIGDADEIASPSAVDAYQLGDGIVRLKQRMFYYYLNCENKEGWDWQKIAPFSEVKRLTPCGIRYPPAGELKLVEGGGWHFSFCGDAEHVRTKLRDYSHQEFNKPEVLEKVETAREQGIDLFGRDLKYEFVEVDEEYPEYVRNNWLSLYGKGLIKTPSVFAVDSGRGRNLTGHVTEFDSAPDLSSRHWTVTAEVSTKDRYTTTLPLTLSAIFNQTRLPDKFVLYDDSEQRIPAEELCERQPYEGLFKLAADKGIKWEIQSTPKLGQVANHQHCLDNADTMFIWRCDDDEVPEPDCLETLLNTIRDYKQGGEAEKIGAVGGLVHHPGAVGELPQGVDGSLNDIAAGLNLSWFKWNGGPREVQHLYSTFLFNVNAACESGGYPRGLSPVGHREESIMTHQMHRAGYTLLCTPWAKTYHLRDSTGGIRSYADTALWEHDEHEWQRLLRTWNVVQSDTKVVVLDVGLGDHFCFLGVFPELRRKFPDRKWVLAVCHPTLFENYPDVTIISIADAKLLLGAKYDEYSIYRYAWDRNLEKPMPEIMMEFFSR